MLTWRSIPAVDHDDGRPVTMAFVGAATVTINRPVPASGTPAPRRRSSRCRVGPTRARRPAWHTAAGGSLALRLGFWLLPITVQYQLARRFTDDQALVHLVQIGL